MIKDKWVKIITICLIIAALAAVILAIIFSDQLTEITGDGSEPAYMTKVFDKEATIDINISVDTDDWDSLIENATDEEYIPCDITINGETFSNIGIRAKGNSSLSMVASDDTTDRFSFKVDFDQYVDGQTLYGLDTLALNNIMGDATYMKEYLSYDMFDSMGIATPGYAYAKINLNGEYWGLYLAVEVIEESFVERNYGSLDGNLYKPESTGMGGGGMSEGGMSEGGMSEGGMPEGGMPEGGMPEGGMPEGEMPEGEMPEGGMPEAKENLTVNDNAQNTEAVTEADNTTNETSATNNNLDPAAEITQNEADAEENAVQNNRNAVGGGMGGNQSSSSGTSLVYVDDQLSSYAGVVENTVMNKTTDSDKQKVVEMIKNLNAGTNLEEYLDVEEVLRYFAVNTFLVNLDSYAGSMKHNYYLYEEDGVFQILPWDFNLSFGAFGMSSGSNVINFPIDEPVTDTMENSPLIAKLLEVDEYKEMYYSYLSELVANYVESGKYSETVNKLDTLISGLVETDPTAFFTFDEYNEAVSQLVIFGEDRATSITAQINGTQLSDDYGTIDTTLNLSAMGSMGGGMGGGMSGGMAFSDENRENADIDTNTAPFSRNQPRVGSTDENSNNDSGISTSNILIIISVVAIVIGFVFLLLVKRKKFRSK